MLRYRCIQCLYPSRYLYRRHGSSKSNNSSGNDIQLSLCRQCGEIVDAYCEREAILVAIDCVLLRPAAYRHVLCNRIYGILDTDDDNRKEVASDDHSVTDSHKSNESPSKLNQLLRLRYIAASCILRAHIGMISTPNHIVDDGDLNETLDAAGQFVALTMVSAIGWTVQLLILGASMQIGASLLRQYRATGRTKQDSSLHTGHSLWTVTAVALLIPLLGIDVATALIHIWENSTMIRQLGFGLAIVHQWMALFTVWELVLAASTTAATPTTRGSSNVNSLFRTLSMATVTALLLLVSVLVRSSVMAWSWHGINALYSVAPSHGRFAMPCAGIRTAGVAIVSDLIRTILSTLGSDYVGGSLCLA